MYSGREIGRPVMNRFHCRSSLRDHRITSAWKRINLMNKMPRITGIVFAITAIILISFSSQAQDGVTLTNEVGPRGKTPHGEMQSTDWSDPDELKRTWDGAKVRIPLDNGVVKATMINSINSFSFHTDAVNIILRHRLHYKERSLRFLSGRSKRTRSAQR